MEKGQLRVDANVSVRPTGSDELRTRTEIKNMNSFTFIARGIEAEVERQIAVWESGDEVRQQTYDFDAGTGTLTARRTKEEADDYRYFPEPDLVPVEPPVGSSSRCVGGAGVAERADPPHRAQPRSRPRDRSRHRRARSAVGRAVAAGADGVAAANVIANTLVGAGIDVSVVRGRSSRSS